MPVSSASGDSVVVAVPWEVDCEDDDPYNGYIDREYCVPGMITRDAWFVSTPRVVIGVLSSYPEGMMERVVANRKMSLDGFIDGISAMSCGDLGKVAWINLPPKYEKWIGPFLVVDCSHRHHMYVNSYVIEFVAEIGYKTASRLGFRGKSGVAVSFGMKGSGDYWTWVSYASWWKSHALEFVWRPGMDKPISTPTSTPTATSTPTTVIEPTATPTSFPILASAPTSVYDVREPDVLPPPATTEKEKGKMNLTLDQVALVSGLVTAAIWLLTTLWVGVLGKPKPEAKSLKMFVFGGSVVLSFFWAPFEIPDLSIIPPIADGLFVFVFGLLDYAMELLAVAIFVFKFAQGIYDLAWQKVMVWLDENVVSKIAGKPTALLMPGRGSSAHNPAKARGAGRKR